MPAIQVDQRQAERHELRQQVSISVVGAPAGVLQGELRNLSEGGTQVRLSAHLSPFTLVKIEYGDNLLLGEVVYCLRAETDWLAGLRIEHALFGLTALSDAIQAFEA